MNLTWELILELYTPGATEWGDLVRRFDEQDRFVEESETAPSAAQAEDELAAWLGNIDLDEEHEHDHDYDRHGHGHGHGDYGARRANAPSDADKGTRGYKLHRCSWCGNLSAVLRKCGGCAKTMCVCVCVCALCIFCLLGVAAHEMIARRRRAMTPRGGSIQILRPWVPEASLDRAQGGLWGKEEVKLSAS